MARFTSPDMVALCPRSAAACLAAALLFAPARARAGDPAGDRAAAAAAFDDGVTRFDQADYAAAARSFLRADELAPSADAVTNAIAAARKANDHLLVVQAAERGVKRAAGNSELATASREALAEAARSLSRLELSCEPAPCSLALDGVATEVGNRYLLPGTHIATTAAMDGNPTEEQLRLIAGAAYTVVLHAAKRGESAQAANISTDVPGAAASPAPPAPPKRDESEARGARKKPIPPAVFYVGVGATAVLVGLGTWSGIDTLSAEGKVPRDDVYGKARRSDILWGSAVVVGALTAASGFLWVDWGKQGGQSAGVVPLEGGAIATAQGRF